MNLALLCRKFVIFRTILYKLCSACFIFREMIDHQVVQDCLLNHDYLINFSLNELHHELHQCLAIKFLMQLKVRFSQIRAELFLI